MISRLLAVFAAAPLLMGSAPPPAPLVNVPLVDVRVAITGLRSTKGVVLACMTSDPARFPRCRGDKAAYRISVPAGKADSLDFPAVAPGTYAIALLHDENDNGKADRVLGMMPREGFGFSRDAKVHMGPPAFGEAAFSVGNAPVSQTIHMRYMF